MGKIRLTATDSIITDMAGYDDISIVWVMEDSYLAKSTRSNFWTPTGPDYNFGWAGIIAVQNQNYSGSYPPPDPSYHLIDRGVIKTPLCYENKTLHIYCQIFNEWGDSQEMGAYAIDPDDWEEMEITWNNQPSIGALLDSKTVNATGWWTFAIGSANSVCLKFVNESCPPAANGTLVRFTSREGPPPYINHPYLTEA